MTNSNKPGSIPASGTSAATNRAINQALKAFAAKSDTQKLTIRPTGTSADSANRQDVAGPLEKSIGELNSAIMSVSADLDALEVRLAFCMASQVTPLPPVAVTADEKASQAVNELKGSTARLKALSARIRDIISRVS